MRQGIGLRTSIAERVHRVIVQNPGVPVRTDEGSYTQNWSNASPAELSVHIRSATAEDIERSPVAGAVISQATHVITAPYHPQITAGTRLLHGAVAYSVLGVASTEARKVDLVMLVAEGAP
jgi:head-tail adaptor